MRTAIVNAAAIVTGDLDDPVQGGGGVLCVDGLITEVGAITDSELAQADVVIDAAGATIAPGLIDSHVHVTFGDYTPRQKTVGYLDSYVHGGVTSVVSAGEVHVPGRPKHPGGVKALAVAAHHCFATYRPGGMRVHAGSLLLEPGLTRADFDDVAAEGVWLCKAGFGAVQTPFDYAPLVADARAAGLVTTLHTGGASIPGSSPVTAEHVLAIDPHVAFHCNGGPTAMADEGFEQVVADGRSAIQMCTAGNLRTTLHLLGLLERRGELARLVLGTDTPTGSGIMPLGLWYTITHLCALGGLDPALAIATATGNNATVFGLDSGFVRVGAAADLLVIDAPLGGSRNDALSSLANGDVVGIGAVVTDGVARFVGGSRNTPPPTRMPLVARNTLTPDLTPQRH